MGYEEVETVLPADFVPRSDSPEQQQLSTSTTAVKGSTNTKQSEEEVVIKTTKSRRSMSRGRSLKKGILNRWRRSKSRTSKKNKKDSSSSNSNSSSGTPTIKKSDSNVTKKVSNSSKTPLVTEEQRGDEVADNNTASSSSINARESPNTLDTVDTNGEQQQQANAADINTTTAATKGGEVVDESLSVEVEDDSGSVKSLQIDKSPSNVSTKSNKSVKSTKSNKSTKSTKSATLDESGSVRSSRSNKSTKSTASSKKSSSSSKQVKSSKSQEDDGQAKYTSSSQGVAAASEEAPSSKNKEGQEEKWVKKVSLSIGGYKTSFQFTDPTTSLANAVNDALTVVGGGTTTADAVNGNTTTTLEQQQADKQYLDTIGETTEGIITEAKECDYDVNPTKLFMYLQQRAWAKALHHLQSNQNESSMWVYRKVKTPTPPSTDDDANVVNSTALVVVPQEEKEDAVVTPKYRWRLLPLHAAIVLGAPTEIIQAIISSYPNAARETDERGSLPVHLAASRLDVDPEGEKVVLQLFGVYPDSIDEKDRKGRTPPELAKLARSRKEIEENRKQEVKDDEEENNEGGEGGEGDDDDDVSVKSSISGRFAALLKGSKSTDTADVRGRRKKKKKKGKKKNTSSQPLGLTSAKSMGADDDDDELVIVDDASVAESLGPGFAFLKTSKPQEERERATATQEETTQEDEQTYDEIVKNAKKAIISKEYQTPEDAPQDTFSPQSIPLPMSFSMGDDVSTAVASMAGSVSDALTSLAASASFSNKDEQQQQQNTKSVTISDEPPQIQIEDNSDESTIASSVDTTVTGNTKIKANEGLRALLEKAVENAGRGGMDVTKFVDLLEDEWVTDVEALRRLDGQTLDRLLPLMLSREIQRLINHADNIDNKFLKAETKRGRSIKSKNNKKKKRSANNNSKKKKVRSITPPSESSLMTINEDLEASPSDDQTIYSIKTERAPSRPKNGLADSEDTKAKDEPVVEDMVVEQSASLEDLEIRRLHANLIADARKKFPTREALEVCIRERQEEVERAVKVGFDVDKETLACAALADDEVRKLLPLRLILPTADDLREMIQVLQTHKEEAMRSLDMIQAANIQSEIDELQEQIDEEERFILKKRMGETQCESCGEMFTSEKKLKGILKVNQKTCQGCRSDNVDSRDDI